MMSGGFPKSVGSCVLQAQFDSMGEKDVFHRRSGVLVPKKLWKNKVSNA
jgi:hypothetical protein